MVKQYKYVRIFSAVHVYYTLLSSREHKFQPDHATCSTDLRLHHSETCAYMHEYVFVVKHTHPQSAQYKPIVQNTIKYVVTSRTIVFRILNCTRRHSENAKWYCTLLLPFQNAP